MANVDILANFFIEIHSPYELESAKGFCEL